MPMLLVKCGEREVCFYSLAEASRLIVRNLWGVPVDGIHSESLRRSYRDKPMHGKKIGRDVFFREDDLIALGYEIDTDKHYIALGDVVELFNEEGETVARTNR